MEIRDKNICGFQAIAVRNALRAFNDEETQFEFVDGLPKYIPKRLTGAYIAEAMQIELHKALELLKNLISEGYLDSTRHTPTSKGMALIGAEDRDRLPWDQARIELEDFLKAVRNANARPGARIFIKKVRVFGSYFEKISTVGDIDLQIFAPLPEECMPEDLDERDQILADIKTSDYLSFHDEWDSIAKNAPGETIYVQS